MFIWYASYKEKGQIATSHFESIDDYSSSLENVY